MATHVFVCRLVPGDLNKLNDTKHCNPDQLNADPQVKNESERVSDHKAAQSIIDNAALGVCWHRQKIDI